MRKKLFVLTFILGLFATVIFAQDPDDIVLEVEPWQPNDGWTFPRGTIGLQTGFWFSKVVYVNLSPRFTYPLNDQAAIGASFTYLYYYESYFDVAKNLNSSYEDHVCGGSIFGKYLVFEQFFIKAELEILSGKVIYDTYPEVVIKKVGIPSFYAGAGYFIPMGKRFLFEVSASMNLLESDFSRTKNPAINFAIHYGI